MGNSDVSGCHTEDSLAFSDILECLSLPKQAMRPVCQALRVLNQESVEIQVEMGKRTLLKKGLLASLGKWLSRDGRWIGRVG